MARFVSIFFLHFRQCLFVAFRLEYRKPTKFITSSWTDDFPFDFSDEQLWRIQLSTHISQYADRACCFVFKWLEHLGQACSPQVLEEPLDVRPWKSFVCVEAKRSIINQNGFLKLLVSVFCLFDSDRLRISLQLGHQIPRIVHSTFSNSSSNFPQRISLNSAIFPAQNLKNATLLVMRHRRGFYMIYINNDNRLKYSVVRQTKASEIILNPNLTVLTHMICLPRLINASELEKIGQFKLTLREITLSKYSLRAKISLVASLKETLKIALQGALKRAEIVKMEENVVVGSTSKLTLLSCKTRGSSCEKQENSARLWIQRHHRALMQEVCSHFQQRNNINITLYQLQKHVDKTSCKFATSTRNSDYQGQAKAVDKLRQSNIQMMSILNTLIEMKESLAVQHEMILDNIKILRAKNSSFEKSANTVANISSKRKTKIRKNFQELIPNNQNANQFLVNL